MSPFVFIRKTSINIRLKISTSARLYCFNGFDVFSLVTGLHLYTSHTLLERSIGYYIFKGGLAIRANRERL